jgi:autophagy-related protein 16
MSFSSAYLNFEAHDGEVNAVKWSPHGLTMATGGSDRKVKIWDISKGHQELKSTLTGSNGAIMSLDFDSAGSLILAASANDFTRWVLNQGILNYH